MLEEKLNELTNAVKALTSALLKNDDVTAISPDAEDKALPSKVKKTEEAPLSKVSKNDVLAVAKELKVKIGEDGTEKVMAFLKPYKVTTFKKLNNDDLPKIHKELTKALASLS